MLLQEPGTECRTQSEKDVKSKEREADQGWRVRRSDHEPLQKVILSELIEAEPDSLEKARPKRCTAVQGNGEDRLRYIPIEGILCLETIVTQITRRI